MSRGSLATLLVFTCIWLVAAPTTYAQRSVIRGVARDSLGELIGDVAVTAESAVSSRVLETDTSSSGRFSFIGLNNGRWLFTLRKRGYQAAQGFASVRRAGNSGTMSFTMEIDLLDPPVASTGLLAGIRADDLQLEVDAAHELFDSGAYDSAISAYEAILENVPHLTSLNLQIGHAYREKREYDQARAAYRKVPPESRARLEAESAIRQLDDQAGPR